METIRIVSKMELQDFVKVNLKLIYRRPISYIFPIVGLILLLSTIPQFLKFDSNLVDTPIPNLIMGISFTILYPLFLYFQIKKNYNTNLRIQERIQYTFTPESMKVKGESFESNLEWAQVHKIVEKADCILIYENRQVAMFLLHRFFNEEEMMRFKILLKSIPELEGKIKKLK